MGESKKYYYVKRKNKSPKSVSFVRAKPHVIIGSNPQSAAAQRSTVLDMDFKVTEQPRLWWGILRWTLLVITAVLVYVTGTWLSFGGNYVKDDILRKGEAAAANLESGAKALASLDMENAASNFKLAEKNFSSALWDFAALGQNHVLLAGLPLERSQLVQGQILMQSGQHLASAGAGLTDALKPIMQYWSGVTALGTDNKELGTEVGQLLIKNSPGISSALDEAEIALELLSSVNANYLPAGYGSMVGEAQSRAQNFYEALSMARSLTERLPVALGFDNPRYYLILNQNNNELRPTGGFIGSYVLAELYKGKLESVFVDNIHRLDGQNRYSDVELPAPLRAVTTYYGVRDANWEPDFPTSVRTIQKLYQEAGGGTVDGVISLTPEVVSDILSVVGPIYMPEYGFDLNSNNFVDRTQKHVEIEAAGDYNPKQLLVDFAPILLGRLIEADSQQLNLIGKKLLRRTLTNDIMVYFSDPELEDVVETLGWSGEILQVGPKDDYLYVVEANLGGNKSSGSLSRTIRHEASIHSTGAVLDQASITWTHNGTDEFPDGVNKNYVRVYLPGGTRVTRVSGYDEGTQTDTHTSEGKSVVGFWVTTEPGQSSVIELEYVLPFRLGDYRNYRLIVQKQSGARDVSLKSEVAVNSRERRTLFEGSLITDQTLTVNRAQ